MHKQKVVSGILALMLFSLVSFAQTKENDPYTILGFGNINDINFANVAAMPGLAATYNDDAINLVNPANNAWINGTNFTIGGFGQYKRFKTDTQTDNIYTGNLSYLAIGFTFPNPLNEKGERKKKNYRYGTTLSLTPYSFTGYDLQVIDDSDPDLGNVRSTFEGNGGTYKFQMGNAFRYKDIGIGINLGYLFGQQTSEQQDNLDSFAFPFENIYTRSSTVRGFVWNVGATYVYRLKRTEKQIEKGEAPVSITLGVYGNSKQNTRITSDYVFERSQVLLGNGTNPLVQFDTLVANIGTKNDLVLPSEFGAGIMFSQALKWKIGMDFSTTNWSGYSNPIDPQILMNSMKIGFGAEFIPNINSIRSYGARMKYRIGGFYRKDPRTVLGGDQFSHVAATFGVGMPLRATLDTGGATSNVNIALEVGQYGDPSFLKELYARITVGLEFGDNYWFFKRKYN